MLGLRIKRRRNIMNSDSPSISQSWGWNWTLENQPSTHVHLANVIPRIRVEGLLLDDEVGVESLKRDLPAILLGCDTPTHMTSEYLRTTYAHKPVPLDIHGVHQEVVEVGAFIDALDVTRTQTSHAVIALRKKYMRNLHMPHWFPDDMKGLQTCPTVFGKNLLEDEARTPCCPQAWRRWSELFVCGKECEGFPVLHVDVCCIHAVSMQIQGTKKFTMFAPSDISNIYAMAPSFTSSALPTDLDNVNLDDFPLFANATVRQHPATIFGWLLGYSTIVMISYIACFHTHKQDNILRKLPDCNS
eukprot:m.159408 g.159408  ORF g.159408 m.159408 type:complete len:301 (-) comp31134_c1_seq4:183-1085(-)